MKPLSRAVKPCGDARPRHHLTSGGHRLAAAVLISLFLVPDVSAQDIIAYPERGQSQQQQQRDRYDCYQWAVGQTGFDPQRQAMAYTPSAAPPPEGQILRGAARGAALGAVGGAIGGDAGQGAAIGAGVGGVFGAIRRRNEQAQYAQAQSQQATAMSQQQGYFNRAMSACMRGRGYSVS